MREKIKNKTQQNNRKGSDTPNLQKCGSPPSGSRDTKALDGIGCPPRTYTTEIKSRVSQERRKGLDLESFAQNKRGGSKCCRHHFLVKQTDCGSCLLLHYNLRYLEAGGVSEGI